MSNWVGFLYNRMFWRSLIWAFLLFLGKICLSQPGLAQNTFGQVVILGVDNTSFPVMQIQSRIYSESGQPASIVVGSALELHENGREARFAIDKVESPLKTVLIVDLNANAFQFSAKGELRSALAMALMRQYITTMRSGDRIAILTVSQSTTEVVVDFSSNKDDLLLSLAKLNNWERAHWGTPSYISDPIPTLNEARILLQDDEDQQAAPIIILITPNLHLNLSSTEKSEIERLSVRNARRHIPIFVAQTNPQADSQVLSKLATDTGGAFYPFEKIDTFILLSDSIAAYRGLFRLTFRSTSGVTGLRVLMIFDNLSSKVLGQTVYRVMPSPQPPKITDFILEPASPITRLASLDGSPSNIPPTEALIRINYQWPDHYPRRLKQAIFRVDGQLYGKPILEPDANIEFIWDLRSYSQPGEYRPTLEVELIDELGLHTGQTLQASIIVTALPALAASSAPAPNAICSQLSISSNLGDLFFRLCQSLSHWNPTYLIAVLLILIAMLFTLGCIRWIRGRS